MKRHWIIWLVFGTGIALAMAAMAFVSREALRLDRAEAADRQEAAVEENVRLALWRMDSAMSPLVAQEDARPYFDYSSFYPIERAYTRMFAETRGNEILMPSPLLTTGSSLILLHFQISPDGSVTSPQAPPPPARNSAGQYTDAAAMTLADQRVADLCKLIDRPQLLASLPAPRAPAAAETTPLTLSSLNFNVPSNIGNGSFLDNNAGQSPQNANGASQQNFSNANLPAQQPSLPLQMTANEAQVRQNSSQQIGNELNGANAGAKVTASGDVSVGVMKPMWMGASLVLARRVTINSQPYVQGAWLDWPAMRRFLLDSVSDLLPAADLQPVADSSQPEPRGLASLPVILIPGDVPSPPAATSPLHAILWIGWACAIAGALAVAILLRGVIALSERRGAFVSAVTHELRTPLTTLRIYTEMLASGMVSDPTKRSEYLATLKTEAGRLGHLVENVLSYSRLERKSLSRGASPIAIGEILNSVEPRLRERAEQAGMTFTAIIDDAAKSAQIRVDRLATEQILFNLVDNACKYARAGGDRRIDLGIAIQADAANFRVIDCGPGVSPEMSRRLFRPFSKSVHEAAESAPGLGLGLALSRRLARDLGGDLQLEPADVGACFLLSFPVLRDSHL